MKKAQLLQGLKGVFPQFRDKSTIIEYYCMYDVPQKQTHLLKMWQDLLKFVNSFFGTLVLSQKQLSQLFQIYGLKPNLLQSIVKALHKNKQLYSLSDLQYVYSENFEGQNTQSSKGFLSNIFGYFYHSKQQIVLDDKIFLKDVIDRKVVQSYYYLRQLFKHSKVQEEHYVIEKLKVGLKLSQNTELILNVLEFCYKIVRVKHITPNHIFYLVIYPGEGVEITQNMIELEQTRFQLRQKVSQINHKIEEIYPQLLQLISKAKQLITQGDKTVSKNLLKQKVLQQKHVAALIDRRQVLNNSLNQLDQNQMNQNIIYTLKQSQDLIKSTTVDLDHLQDLKLNNQEIRYNLEQADRIYKQVAGNNIQQENIYRQLQMQLEHESSKHDLRNSITKNRMNNSSNKQIQYQ